MILAEEATIDHSLKWSLETHKVKSVQTERTLFSATREYGDTTAVM